MALFCDAIRRNSVSLLKFSFLSHVQVLSREMLFISRLKRPWSCFPTHFFPCCCHSVIYRVVNIVSDARYQSSFVEKIENRYWEKSNCMHISNRLMVIWYKKWSGDLKIETESLLIATQNNAIRTNHESAKIDKTPQNCTYWLRRDSAKRGNYIISECNKLTQRNTLLGTNGWEKWSLEKCAAD